MDLIIDQEFQNLIPPLTKSEYDHLEISIKSEGCRDPLILWHGIIVDGHNRYEICTRLKIPYTTEEHVFSSRAEVISWICLNQLSRRNITLEAYQYLVGKRYDAEKTINQQKMLQDVISSVKHMIQSIRKRSRVQGIQVSCGLRIR